MKTAPMPPSHELNATLRSLRAEHPTASTVHADVLWRIRQQSGMSYDAVLTALSYLDQHFVTRCCLQLVEWGWCTYEPGVGLVAVPQ